ncbi:MAG TPA: hypothetical protein DEQ40_06625, partial [Oxalobacteraceae bacterium]|nr:hypothetical protein [Oxalobacteraceae bacterium]
LLLPTRTTDESDKALIAVGLPSRTRPTADAPEAGASVAAVGLPVVASQVGEAVGATVQLLFHGRAIAP